ncbi:PQQ-dependent methanol/ethanol family dehydrogenase [soil metagenome]
MTDQKEQQHLNVSRRGLLAGTGAIVAAVALATTMLKGSNGASADVAPAANGATPVPLGDTIPPELSEYAEDWPTPQGNLAATRAALNSAIDSSNVSQLGVAWRFPLTAVSGYGAATANPIVVGEAVYLQDMESNVFALDRATGAVKWTKEYKAATIGPNGVAVGYGRVIGALETGEVFALDAETGDEIWKVSLPTPFNEGIDMAPLIYDNTIYISTVPGRTTGFYQGGMKGVFYAMSINDGTLLWWWDTVADSLWGNTRVNSGGGLWYPPAVDEKTGTVFASVANPAPYPGTEEFPAGSSRPGDNLYTDSVVSLNPETGGLNWYYQVKPHDLFDLDNQLSPVLTTATIGGAEKEIVLTSGKHGYVVAVDRATGELIWKTAVGKHQNDELAASDIPDASEPSVPVFPGTYGGVESPFSTADGVVYVPVYNLATNYWGSGADGASIDFTTGYGQVVAIDAATGDIIWDIEEVTGILGGTAVANDVVFSGGMDGIVRAYSTKDGSKLWTHQLGAGVNAPAAIAGDELFVVAGGIFIASTETAPDTASAMELVAFKLGATGDATPTA